MLLLYVSGVVVCARRSKVNFNEFVILLIWKLEEEELIMDPVNIVEQAELKDMSSSPIFLNIDSGAHLLFKSVIRKWSMKTYHIRKKYHLTTSVAGNSKEHQT